MARARSRGPHETRESDFRGDARERRRRRRRRPTPDRATAHTDVPIYILYILHCAILAERTQSLTHTPTPERAVHNMCACMCASMYICTLTHTHKHERLARMQPSSLPRRRRRRRSFSAPRRRRRRRRPGRVFPRRRRSARVHKHTNECTRAAAAPRHGTRQRAHTHTHTSHA